MEKDLKHIKDTIYSKLHIYYNTRTRLTDAFTAAGLPDNPTQGQINQLNDIDVRGVKIAVLSVVIDALELGAIEDEIKALGFASIQAAYDDAPEHIIDPVELQQVQKNITVYMVVRNSLASMIDKNLVMTQITGAKGVVNVLEEVIDVIGGVEIKRINELNRSTGIPTI